jgi:Domain of unknown function (DUF3472)
MNNHTAMPHPMLTASQPARPAAPSYSPAGITTASGGKPVRLQRLQRFLLTVIATLATILCATVQASQHLFWKHEDEKNATCLYGEITVLVSHPAIYYCGANWHPRAPAGGYCGIQDTGEKGRLTIFSIWDTGKGLHSKATEADPRTVLSSGCDGKGGQHTHMFRNWQEGRTFQFFVQKQPGDKPDTTDTRYYIIDHVHKRWILEATINSPNGGFKGVTDIGGGPLGSFLENYRHTHFDAPRIALYRLWLGDSIHSMKFLGRAGGDNDRHGLWGQMHGSYFLAEGSPENLDRVFDRLKEDYGTPIIGKKGEPLEPLPDVPMPPKVIQALENPPRADKVKESDS